VHTVRLGCIAAAAAAAAAAISIFNGPLDRTSDPGVRRASHEMRFSRRPTRRDRSDYTTTRLRCCSFPPSRRAPAVSDAIRPAGDHPRRRRPEKLAGQDVRRDGGRARSRRHTRAHDTNTVRRHRATHAAHHLPLTASSSSSSSSCN